MSRSVLRLVSLFAITAIMAVATARTVCLLPCAVAEWAADATAAHTTGGAHCDQPTGDTPTTLSAADSTCSDCNAPYTVSADRLSARAVLHVNLASMASAWAAPEMPGPSGDRHEAHRLTRSGRTAAAPALPLRI